MSKFDPLFAEHLDTAAKRGMAAGCVHWRRPGRGG